MAASTSRMGWRKGVPLVAFFVGRRALPRMALYLDLAATTSTRPTEPDSVGISYGSWDITDAALGVPVPCRAERRGSARLDERSVRTGCSSTRTRSRGGRAAFAAVTS